MKVSLCVAALSALILITSANETQPRTRFQYFDDYLLSVASPDNEPSVVYAGERPRTSHRDPASRERLANNDDPMALPTDDEDMPSSGEEPDAIEQQETNEVEESEQEVVRDTDIVGYFRDVPREHWSCCMLGKLAGDKGFHCHAGFYAARVSMTRNHNRAHNQKMLFHGRHRIAHWGSDIMSTFGRCVERHAAEFHKCCYAASNERTERHRWYVYRRHPTTVAPPPTTAESQEEEEN